MEKNINSHTWCVIIAGGKGTRLFPISHGGCPKQFCNLNSSQTFIQATIQRFLNLGVDPTKIVVITTNESQTQLAKEQTKSLGVLSQNICQTKDSWGYPGVMVKAAEVVYAHDPDAIIVNTPSDQYIVEHHNFKKAFKGSLEIAEKGGVAIIGVKITDLTTAIGCGHMIYDPNEGPDEFGFNKMIDFVEKPAEEIADKLMRSSSSACNTGINVWKASTLLKTIDTTKIEEMQLSAKVNGMNWQLTTDQFLKSLPEVYTTTGVFDWYDCGTLKALYEISPKTQHHKNASIGDGEVDRTDCLGSLFYAADGFRLHVAGFRDTAVVANVIEMNGKVYPIVCTTKLSKSQKVKDLAEDIRTSKSILSVDFQIDARNNLVMRSNVSDEVVFGFVGVQDCIVNIYKNFDGTFDVFASQQKVVEVPVSL